MIVLGLETSCDETAVALVTDGGGVLAEAVASQDDRHARFGGVVPEIAARAHAERLPGMVARALQTAALAPDAISAVAATVGPGLIGGVMVGAVYGKAAAAALGVPFLGINHLEGHALTPRLTSGFAFPYLLLLVSGGHSQLLVVEAVGAYRLLGGTIDDAAGEAFDKVAKLLDLGFPGGPAVERIAATATRPERFALPVPLQGRAGFDVSFSGLKTAVRRQVELLGRRPDDADRADLAAAFQARAVQHLAERTRRAAERYRADYPNALTPALVVAGGVAANRAVRAALEGEATRAGLRFHAPPLAWCGDNAVMIAWAGVERLRLGDRSPLDMPARPRWPLAEMTRLDAEEGFAA